MANSLHIDSTPNALFSCINSAGCGRAPPGQKSRGFAQDFIAAFEFVILAFERLDAGILRLLGYGSEPPQEIRREPYL